MSRFSDAALLGAAGMLLITLPSLAKNTPKAPVQTAVIENTGSTNTTGYQLQVSSDGSGSWVLTANTEPVGASPHTHLDTVTYKLGTIKNAGKFFADLKAAMPLTGLPERHGMRSASFGTETFITYKGQRSPDLTFASDPRTVALKADIDAITKTLHVGNAPKRPAVVIMPSANPVIITPRANQ